MDSILIPRQFRGPARSANGGYTCGTIAELVGADVVEVTLRRPPPLDSELAVEPDGAGGIRVLSEGEVVAEARPSSLELELPAVPSFAEARRISEARGDDPDHPFPGCFVCGPARDPGDGLRLRPAPLGDGCVVAPWLVEPEFAGARFAWAALDCPGGWAVQPDATRGISVVGRLTGRVLSAPEAGDECVVVGWPLGEPDGRRHRAGTAIFRDGSLLAMAEAIWFEMDDAVRDSAR
ncbi:MAG TPA: hypothetical protein VKR79_08235 [Gaiellaceae bacterium]|nr:hypothetical protein [Gaiellaceae bacterium]